MIPCGSGYLMPTKGNAEAVRAPSSRLLIYDLLFSDLS